MSLRNGDPANVYFIENVATGAVKIGITSNVWHRLVTLRGSIGQPVRLVAISGGDGEWTHRRLERGLHGVFRSDRIQSEWFRPSPLMERLIRMSKQAEFYVGDANQHDAVTLDAFHKGRFLLPKDLAPTYDINAAPAMSPDAAAYWGEWSGLL